MRTKLRKLFNILCFFITFSSWNISLGQSNYYYGEFQVWRVINYYDTIAHFTSFQCHSMICSDSVKAGYDPSSDDYGNLVFDGAGLRFDTIIQSYVDTLERDSIENFNWSFSSTNSVVPSFSIAGTDSFPNIINYNILPDTIKKSDSLYVDFGSVSNCDSVDLTIFDGVFRLDQPMNWHVSGTNDHITVSSTALDNLSGEDAKILLSFYKTEYVIVGGRRHKFTKRTNLIHLAKIVS